MEKSNKICMNNIDEVRNMFLNPEVSKPNFIQKKDIQKDKLISYLCDENDFSIDRISNMIKMDYIFIA